MVEFKVKRHQIRDIEMCEVWIDGEMKAAIYPNDAATGIRIMSRHVDGEPLPTAWPDDDVRCWEFNFKGISEPTGSATPCADTEPLR